MSRARHIIDNQVYIVKIHLNFKPKVIPDVFEDDPVFTKMGRAVYPELQNGSRGVLECFAEDAGYTNEHINASLSSGVMGESQNVDIHEDLGMFGGNIEIINDSKE